MSILDKQKLLGLRLKKLRESKGIAKQRLVDQGFTHKLISNIEESRQNYRIKTLLRYLELIGEDISKL